jgi:sialidase-1
VFVSGEDGYVGYRIPALETAPDGSLLALAEGRKYNLGDPGYEGNDIDLVARRSTDGGANWLPMRIVEDPGEKWSAGNPATLVDRQTRRIWLFYLRCKPGRNTETARPGTDDSQILARTSDDNGITWSAPIDLTNVSRDLADPKWRCSVVGHLCAVQRGPRPKLAARRSRAGPRGRRMPVDRARRRTVDDRRSPAARRATVAGNEQRRRPHVVAASSGREGDPRLLRH